jgi:nucleotide-binding universal stress UspA family protein
MLRALALRVVQVASAPPETEVGLAALVAELHVNYPQLAVKAVHLEGPAVASLVDFAESVPPVASPAQLLVLGVRGAGGFAGLRLGSVALEAAAQATVPVVLVPSGPDCRGTRPTLNPVALGIDVHRPSDAALDFAFDAAHRRHVAVRAVYAWSPRPRAGRVRPAWAYEEARTLAEELRPWRLKYPDVRVIEDIAVGSPAEVLVRLSRCSDLLVVGRRGNVLGPVARALAEGTEDPAAVVPA